MDFTDICVCGVCVCVCVKVPVYSCVFVYRSMGYVCMYVRRLWSSECVCMCGWGMHVFVRLSVWVVRTVV